MGTLGVIESSPMETTRTGVCKLAPTPAQTRDIDASLKAFAAGSACAAETARASGSTNKIKIQAAGSTQIRTKFGLSAHLAIRVIARACAALKAPAQMHSGFAPTAIDYDARIFAFHEGNWTFGLTLLAGRVKLATVLGQRQKALLKGRKSTAAQLVKRKDGGYDLHVQWTDTAPEPMTVSDHLGVDLGLANIATDSDGERHTGKDVEHIRRKHNLQRKRLRHTNTRGAKTQLKRSAGKEARFRRHQNHVLSKTLVATAKRTGRGIAREDLQGIRDRIRARGGDAWNRLSGWSFHQRFSFLAYKAKRAGVPVVPVDPRNTSRMCSVCGPVATSNRKNQAEFLCKACGHEEHADGNAARNIRALAVSRNAAIELAG